MPSPCLIPIGFDALALRILIIFAAVALPIPIGFDALGALVPIGFDALASPAIPFGFGQIQQECAGLIITSKARASNPIRLSTARASNPV